MTRRWPAGLPCNTQHQKGPTLWPFPGSTGVPPVTNRHHGRDARAPCFSHQVEEDGPSRRLGGGLLAPAAQTQDHEGKFLRTAAEKSLDGRSILSKNGYMSLGPPSSSAGSGFFDRFHSGAHGWLLRVSPASRPHDQEQRKTFLSREPLAGLRSSSRMSPTGSSTWSE